MAKQIFNAVNDAGKAAYQASRDLGEINVQAFQKLIDVQFNLATQILNQAVKQVELLSTPKDAKDLVTAQVELARSGAEQGLDQARELVELNNDTRQAYTTWLDKGVQETVDNLNKAQATVKTAAA